MAKQLINLIDEIINILKNINSSILDECMKKHIEHKRLGVLPLRDYSTEISLLQGQIMDEVFFDTIKPEKIHDSLSSSHIGNYQYSENKIIMASGLFTYVWCENDKKEECLIAYDKYRYQNKKEIAIIKIFREQFIKVSAKLSSANKIWHIRTLPDIVENLKIISREINKQMNKIFGFFNIQPMNILEPITFDENVFKLIDIFISIKLNPDTKELKMLELKELKFDIYLAYLLDFALFDTSLSLQWRNFEQEEEKIAEKGLLTKNVLSECDDPANHLIKLYKYKDEINSIREKVRSLIFEIAILNKSGRMFETMCENEIRKINAKYRVMYDAIQSEI